MRAKTMAVGVPTTVLLSPSLYPEARRGNLLSIEVVNVLGTRYSSLEDEPTTASSFLARLSHYDKNLVGNGGELELRCVPACQLWAGTTALETETFRLAGNERLSPQLVGKYPAKVLLLMKRSIQGEREVTGECTLRDVEGESEVGVGEGESVWVSETDSESELSSRQPQTEGLPGLKLFHIPHQHPHKQTSLSVSTATGQYSSLLQPVEQEVVVTNERAQDSTCEPNKETIELAHHATCEPNKETVELAHHATCEPRRTNLLTPALETATTEQLRQDGNGTTLPEETNVLPTVMQETKGTTELPLETKGTTKLPLETKGTTELLLETKGTTELPLETKGTTELPLEATKLVLLPASEADQKNKTAECDVVMSDFSDERDEEKSGANRQREANESDSGLNSTVDSLFLQSGSSVEEVPMIVCTTVGGAVGEECMEEGESGEGEGREKGEEGEGSDEGIGMEEVGVGSEGGSVIVVIGSEDEEEGHRTTSGIEPVISCCGMELGQSDLCTLSPNNCLNDQVVNCYMKLLLEQAVRKPGTVAIASTFFYTKLCRCGFSGVARWMKNVDFGRLRLFLVPVHLPAQHHWCLTAVHIRRKVIEYYDSLGCRNPSCLKRLLKFVLKRTQKQSKHRTKQALHPKKCHWRKIYPKGLPRQSGSYDCGVFMCQFARWLCCNIDNSSVCPKIPFTQSHMRRLRHSMRTELESERLFSVLTRKNFTDHPHNF